MALGQVSIDNYRVPVALLGYGVLVMEFGQGSVCSVCGAHKMYLIWNLAWNSQLSLKK